MQNTTLCYIEQNGAYLMLHRVKKKNDENKDKWIGIGGHFEGRESPEDCVRREVFEETGLTLPHLSYRGVITFNCAAYEIQLMHLFYADAIAGTLREDCNEGTLEWVKKEDVLRLPIWEGDRIFLRLLDKPVPFFSLKLDYDENGVLLSHALQFCGNTAPAKEPLLISACLTGTPCRFDGKSKPMDSALLEALAERYTLIPVCAEVLGGLPTPRIPAEIQPDRTILRRDGVSVTAEYQRGAEAVLSYAKLNHVRKALLKARSPSCGVGQIYDGSFSKALISGDGVTAALLRKHGISLLTEEHAEDLL